MIPEAEALIVRLTSTRDDLLRLLKPIAVEVVDWRPSKDALSIADHLLLLLDKERVFRRLALRWRTDPAERFPAAFTVTHTFVDLPTLLDTLGRERRLTIFALQELQPADLNRQGQHQAVGPVSMLWTFEQILREERRAIRAIQANLDRLPLTGGR